MTSAYTCGVNYEHYWSSYLASTLCHCSSWAEITPPSTRRNSGGRKARRKEEGGGRRGGVGSPVRWLNFSLHHMIDIPALCGRRCFFLQAEESSVESISKLHELQGRQFGDQRQTFEPRGPRFPQKVQGDKPNSKFKERATPS